MEVAGGDVGAPSPPRRVVVAVDESEESMHALSWCLSNVVSAARAAAVPPPAVVLVHARSPRPFYYPAAVDGSGEIRLLLLLLPPPLAATVALRPSVMDHVLSSWIGR